MVYRKKLYIENIRFFSVDYVKTNGSHDCTHMTSHTIWVDEITGVIISTKKVNKNWNFCNFVNVKWVKILRLSVLQVAT